MKKVFIACLLLLFMQPIFAMEKIIYTLRGDHPSEHQDVSSWLNTLQQHPHGVNMIISQAYQVDQNGRVWGDVSERLLTFARQHNIRFMPLLTNRQFSPKIVARFLSNRQAQDRAITSVVDICKKYHYIGIQMDFEDVPGKYRKQLTNFYQRLAWALHRNGKKVSAALFPVTTDRPATPFLRRQYNNWGAVYDYTAIGRSSDFVTIMTYNQHLGATTPGPIAGVPWMNRVIVYTLRHIPAWKVSLGIPGYSGYWQTRMVGAHGYAVGDGISYKEAEEILHQNHAPLFWDAPQQLQFSYFNRNQFNEYLFLENARSFAAKVKLVRIYHLRGFSLWRLGLEDPAIWWV